MSGILSRHGSKCMSLSTGGKLKAYLCRDEAHVRTSSQPAEDELGTTTRCTHAGAAASARSSAHTHAHTTERRQLRPAPPPPRYPSPSPTEQPCLREIEIQRAKEVSIAPLRVRRI